jgi:hypothetical protein
MQCDWCVESVVRIRRRKWERLVYAAVLQCPKCKRKTKLPKYPTLFLLSLHRSCPKCGTPQLDRLRKRDKIDPLYLNPLSLVQRLFGAHLYWCPFCRVQFYDLRPPWPVNRSGAGPSTSAPTQESRGGLQS